MEKKMRLWNRDINPYNGFDDSYLRDIVDESYVNKIDRYLGYKPYTRFFWASELYSFGKCYRDQLNWPNWLPLPFYSDHGVCITSSLQEHEKNNKASYHLTWALSRYQCLSKHEEKKIVRTTYPWIKYRRKNNYSINNDAKGTIIFYAHTNVGIEIEEFNDDEYFSQLQSLPEEYHPLVICLHQHDIKKGIHKRLRKYNIPIITMGFTFSPYFIDRFYYIASHFKNATSPTGGSELFITTELGMNYFILGQEPIYVNKSHKQNDLGVLDRSYDSAFIEISNKKRELFSYGGEDNAEEKIKFCNQVLGLDGESVIDLKDLKLIFVKELLRLSPLYIKIKIINLIKKIRMIIRG